MRHMLVGLALGVVSLGFRGQPQAISDVSRSVTASVANSNGLPVRDLTAADFAITVNGAEVAVERAETDTRPLSLIAIADGLWTDETIQARAAMTNVATALMRYEPSSMFGIMAAEGAEAPSMMRVSDLAWKRTVDRFIQSGRSAPLLESITMASHTLEHHAGRRVVLVITHRWTPTAISPQAVRDALKRADAELWVLDYAQSTKDPKLAEEEVLRRVVGMTGGRRRSILNNRLDQGATTLMRQILTTYRLTFSTTTDGVVRVGVRRPGVSVAAKTWASDSGN